MEFRHSWQAGDTRAHADGRKLRNNSVAYWNAGTFGHPGASLQLQDDGNLVIRDQTGTLLWQTNTTQTWRILVPRKSAEPCYGHEAERRPLQDVHPQRVRRPGAGPPRDSGEPPARWGNSLNQRTDFGRPAARCQGPAGNVTQHNQDWTIRLGRQAQTVTDLQNILVSSTPNGPVRVRDVAVGGEAQAQGESFQQVFQALGPRVVLLYLLMAVLFESLLFPLIVLLSPPLALVDAFGLLTGNMPTLLSMSGMILLTGLVGRT